MALVGFGFSLDLTYLELFEINAICQWCVGSAVIMTALAVLTGVRAVRGEDPPQDVAGPAAVRLGPSAEPTRSPRRARSAAVLHRHRGDEQSHHGVERPRPERRRRPAGR